MANGLSSALNIKVQQTIVFDYPSVASMAHYLFSLIEQPGVPESAAALISAPQLTMHLPAAGSSDLIKVGN